MPQKQTFLNSVEDCKWLRTTHLKDSMLNNELPFEFKSFVLFGNEDCPLEIIIYPDKHPTVKPTQAAYRAMLMDNGHYSLFKVV